MYLSPFIALFNEWAFWNSQDESSPLLHNQHLPLLCDLGAPSWRSGTSGVINDIAVISAGVTFSDTAMMTSAPISAATFMGTCSESTIYVYHRSTGGRRRDRHACLDSLADFPSLKATSSCPEVDHHRLKGSAFRHRSCHRGFIRNTCRPVLSTTPPVGGRGYREAWTYLNG